MMKLSHEVLLALAYVSQISDPDLVRSRFIEALNGLDEVLSFEFVERLPPEAPGYRVLPIATLRSSFGYAVMAESPETGEAEHAVFRSAFQFLAVLLENRMQAQALESKYVSLLKEINQEKSMVRTVLNTLPVGVWVTDAKGTILMGNAAGQRIWAGVRHVGTDQYAEYKAWWPGTDKRIEPEEWAVAQAIETGETFIDQEIDIECFDGKHKTILNSAAPLVDDQRRVIGAVGINQDITVRKQAEEALRESEAQFKAMFEMASIGMAQADPRTGQWLRVNRKMCEITGYSSSEMLAMRIPEITHVEDRERDWEAFQDVVKGKSGNYRLEKRYIRKDGTIVWVNVNMTVIHDFSGQPMRTMATIEDISERKRAEEEKAILQDQLFQAQKMESIGRLAGGVAHDFNNMLSIIIGHAEMVLDEIAPGEPFHHDVMEMKRAAQRSADLTRQLLAFARGQTISPKVLDLNETAAGILKMLRRLIGEDINLEWIPGLDVWPVTMDPGQIDQILANLAVNARDAIGGVGAVTLETANVVFDETYCQAHSGCTPGSYVLLAVSDTGAGMDKETLERIFEPFFTTKELGKGTGLGLATVYGIVKQNNGFINVYSEPGHGTTFKIYLPRVEVDALKAQPAQAVRRDLRGTETVLLVEDEASILTLGKAILERCGYAVLASHRPDEALRIAESHLGPIHLLITDVVMPGMNGKDLRDKLKALRPGIKCIFMSGYTANVIAHHGVLDEGVDFIQKPFSKQDLATKVREALGGDDG
jgi:PAS domain S-box-containing protein